MSSTFGTYLVAQLPGWALALVLALLLDRWTDLPAWALLALLAGWIAKDLLLFPAMSPYYRSEPAARRIVGEAGTAVTNLAPEGFVRVRGELWQARATGHVREGTQVRVEQIEGLLLFVRPHGADRADRNGE